MKIPITKIKDPDILVPINSEFHRIEQIKNEIAACASEPEMCQVEVFDMWDDMSN